MSGWVENIKEKLAGGGGDCHPDCQEGVRGGRRVGGNRKRGGEERDTGDCHGVVVLAIGSVDRGRDSVVFILRKDIGPSASKCKGYRTSYFDFDFGSADPTWHKGLSLASN